MIKSILVLENGTEISAGAMETNAIQNVSVEESCNDGEDLSFGSVCAKKITVNIITPKNKVPISAGEKIILYEEESGVRRKKGVFTSERPQRKNSNSTKIEAYDNISLLDKDITDWFNSLDAFPYTSFDLASLTFRHCGIGFSNIGIKNGDFKINEIKFASVTARQIIRWIGEICGCFCVADENGNATYRWYKENNTTITADGSEGSVIFLPGTLSYEDYEVKGVDRVQIQQGSEDLGISYPENLEGGNVYKISANPFLMVSEESAIKTIAQSLYDSVKNQIYTPCRVRVPASFKFDVGDIVRIEDANGVIIKSYIMRRNRNGNVENIECTGNYERNGATSLYNTDFSSQYGTTLTIQKGLGELRIRAERADRALAEYKIEVSDTYATQSMLSQYKDDTSDALAEYKQEVSDTYATQSMLTEYKTDASEALAEYKTEVGNTYATQVMLSEYKSEVSKSLTEITQTADKDRSAIELLVEYDSAGNPTASGSLIISAINGESTAKISADRLDIDGKTLNIKVSATNISGSLTIGQLPESVAQTDDIPTNVSELKNDSGFQTESNVVSIIDGRITADYVEGLNCEFEKGKIGGFTITSKNIFSNKYSLGYGVDGIYIGTDGIGLGSDFKVTHGGYITAESGKIGGNTIDSNGLHISKGEIFLGSTFSVTSDGKVTATSGTIGGFTIGTNSLYSSDFKIEYDNITFSSGTVLTSGSGGLYVEKGGLNVGKDLYVSGNISVLGGTGQTQTVIVGNQKLVFNNGILTFYQIV